MYNIDKDIGTEYLIENAQVMELVFENDEKYSLEAQGFAHHDG